MCKNNIFDYNYFINIHIHLLETHESYFSSIGADLFLCSLSLSFSSSNSFNRVACHGTSHANPLNLQPFLLSSLLLPSLLLSLLLFLKLSPLLESSSFSFLLSPELSVGVDISGRFCSLRNGYALITVYFSQYIHLFRY